MGEHAPARWAGSGKRSVRAAGTTPRSRPGGTRVEATVAAPVDATDAARALADEAGIDLAAIGKGTGADDRITKGDVEQAITARDTQVEAPAVESEIEVEGVEGDADGDDDPASSGSDSDLT